MEEKEKQEVEMENSEESTASNTDSSSSSEASEPHSDQLELDDEDQIEEGIEVSADYWNLLRHLSHQELWNTRKLTANANCFRRNASMWPTSGNSSSANYSADLNLDLESARARLISELAIERRKLGLVRSDRMTVDSVSVQRLIDMDDDLAFESNLLDLEKDSIQEGDDSIQGKEDPESVDLGTVELLDRVLDRLVTYKLTLDKLKSSSESDMLIRPFSWKTVVNTLKVLSITSTALSPLSNLKDFGSCEKSDQMEIESLLVSSVTDRLKHLYNNDLLVSSSVNGDSSDDQIDAFQHLL